MATRQPDRLQVTDLSVAFDGGRTPVVHELSFRVAAGEAYGLVGESGSGKSLTCQAILGLLPRGGVATGRIEVGGLGVELGRGRPSAGNRVGMIFQDPMSALNPVQRVGHSIAQVIASHDNISTRAARAHAVELMQRVGIRDAQRRSRNYPHEFSGGMRQRIVIAMALAVRPDVLLADEPTTALDVIVQKDVLAMIRNAQQKIGSSILFVTHDMTVHANIADRLGIMYAGRLVEEAPTGEIFKKPMHPFTAHLVASLPKIGELARKEALSGSPPNLSDPPAGCRFHPRCALAMDACREASPALTTLAPGHRVACYAASPLVRPIETIDRTAGVAPLGQCTSVLQ